MLRPSFLAAMLAIAAPAAAQPPGRPGGPGGPSTTCRVTITPSSSAWIIQGYDPFGGAIPEGTFSVTFRNDGESECRFTPLFELSEPPFGLSKGTGKKIGYALLNLSESQDVTPRVGRSVRTPGQRELVLAANETRSVLYRLLAEPDDVKESGTFTQNVTLEAQDAQFRSVGGSRLVLGINVLPSARIGLTGAYTVSDGHAVVDLGELRQGTAPVPLQLRVNSTGSYRISVASANAGRLRLGASEWYVPYSVAIGGNSVVLSGTGVLSGPTGEGFRQDALPIHFIIGDVSNRRAGTYSDVLTVSVAAQ